MIAHALKCCKTFIESQHDYYVCSALETCRVQGLISEEAFEASLNYIDKQLDGNYSLDTWIHDNRFTLYKEIKALHPFLQKAAFRKIRLQWIDHMVEVLNA